ncbi:hypothetical protein [Pseudoalteromonas denitrificans]|nr:hypothetical protein [Pseudoalteromonas denitrificans]
MMTKLYFVFLISVMSAACWADNTLKICIDDREWYPFIYHQDGKAKGLFVEITKAALAHNKIDAKFLVMPMKRCINVFARQGKVDAVIGVPFDKTLANKLHYPDDAQSNTSRWRLMQIDFNLVTPVQSTYDFSGQFQTIPRPIRIPKAYSKIIQKMNAKNIPVEISKQDESSFYKLIRDNSGSLITSSIMAVHQDETEKFHDKFIVHPYPIASLSYFLAFFDTKATSPALHQKIWMNIEYLRNDYVFMLQLLSEY